MLPSTLTEYVCRARRVTTLYLSLRLVLQHQSRFAIPELVNQSSAKHRLTTSSVPPNPADSPMFPTHSSPVDPGTIPEQNCTASYSWTPSHNLNSIEITSEFLPPPLMGNPGVMPNPQSPHKPQTTPPQHTLPGIATTPDIRPRGNSSQPGPTEDLQSPHQLLEQQEAMWFQRCKDREKELEAKFYCWSQEYEAIWFQRSQEWHKLCEKKSEEITEKSAEIARLIVRPSSPLVSYYF